jgi:hypothetical protein
MTDLLPRYEEWIALLGPGGDRYGDHDVSWSLRAGDIVNGAARAGQSIKTFLDRLEPYRLLGAPLPELTSQAHESLPSRTVDRFDRAMLMAVGNYGRVTFSDSISPLALIQIAGKYGWTLGETHSRLTPLEVIGLKLEYTLEVSLDEIVTWQDLLILTENLDGQTPALLGKVSPEHIASSAIEIGEPHTHVIDRLLRFSLLFKLEVG